MRITVLADGEALDREAAAFIWKAAEAKPDLLICLASGGTPTGTYALLAQEPERLARARFIQLDEWAGVAPEDPASCADYLHRTVRGPSRCRPNAGSESAATRRMRPQSAGGWLRHWRRPGPSTSASWGSG